MAAQAALDDRMHAITRHADVRRLLSDPRCSAIRLPSAEEMGRGRAEFARPLELVMNRMAAFSDPPRHDHVRRPLQRAFAPRTTGPLQERFAQMARSHVAAVEDGEVDVTAALAEPLMNAAVASMLRLPPDAPPAVRELWSQASMSPDGLGSGVSEHSAARLAEIHVYLGALLDHARAHPGDDALGVLVAAADEDEELTDADLVANLIFVINSGHRALAMAFALFLHTLATDPERWTQLRGDPDSVPEAVDALLRHDTSVLFTSRRVTEPIDLGEQGLERDDLAVLMLGAANHDPAHASSAHVSFGYGPHFCAGGAVSRIILREALAALVERAPRLELVGEPAWSTFRPNMRGPDVLPVAW
jgi:unspecific monooxygenase